MTLSGQRLISTKRGSRHESELADEAAVSQALEEQFGIVLAR